MITSSTADLSSVLQVPEQDNDYDCGLYTMEYAEQYIKHMPGEIDTKRKSVPVEEVLSVRILLVPPLILLSNSGPARGPDSRT